MCEQSSQDRTPIRSPPPEYVHALHLAAGGMAVGSISASNTAPIDVSSLLLPEHLRLTRWSWAGYKETIPVLCALRGVDDHLHNGRPEGQVLDKKWEEDDTLCKAIILFNITDRSCLERVFVSSRSDASQIWNGLVAMHERHSWKDASSAEQASVIVCVTTVLGIAYMVVFSNLGR
ncbi:hypothetical protein GSI_13024 [Ganoderma sinense ZZ0214-1]|uniref:Uncharacterized protein n=1 Tax=Ganoderma sinense ZZ0214-1 TaxID=1077348 RepID=A0A2G8RUE7_9APHY|nr:hypothetical protein GSI_13024 [Ganoderma sinense ZZ0214-1]